MSAQAGNKLPAKTEFGNPVLRKRCKRLSAREIQSVQIKKLIADMKYLLAKKNYGIGLAAPQVGYAVALGVIDIKPTHIRPDLPKSEWLKMVIINPRITKTYGRATQKWEGCLSCPGIFAKVPRYKKVEVKYTDETGNIHKKVFSRLTAHVLQHEIAHLSGELFIDKVTDTRTFMTEIEFIQRIVRPKPSV